SSFLRFFVFSYVSLHPPSLPFSPTRRSSDLGGRVSTRLNIFEFAGMLGILGGLGVVALVPAAWGWKLALAIVSAPVVISLLLLRSEEHTSELQSLTNLVCRLLLEKKKNNYLN